ncbi:MAG: hypothetical protein R3E87_23700 [Burkholderiaceae bacterium]
MSTRWIGILLSIGLFSANGWAADNLLSANGARLMRDTLAPEAIAAYGTLTDGRLDGGTLNIGASLEVVVEFQSMVTAERLVVHRAGRGEAVSVVELLGSMNSSETGYRVLRSATVAGTQRRVAFDFPPAGFRWLMLRVQPADGVPDTHISEIEILGRSGAPESDYAFQDSPAAARQVLETIGKRLQLPYSDAERSLFADAADGRLDQWQTAEAALLVSGVADGRRRARLQARLNDWVGDARRATSGLRDPMARARRLLTWMHERALTGRYRAEQTDLSTLIETGDYNCVSSAVLYALIGTELGLDVRGIEVPDHALAIVYDGIRHADVETTTPRGFDPARDRAALAAFTKRTGYGYIPSSRVSQRRETSLLGLIALIQYNHGVAALRRADYEEALLANTRALSLDAGLNSAVKNSIATLGRWAAHEAKAGDFERAVDHIEAGLALAPNDAALNHNRRVVWQQRINAAAERLAPDAFRDLIARANAAVPEAGFDRQQALTYIRSARALAERGQWAPAFDVASQGAGRLNDPSQAELDRYRSALLARWMSAMIEADRWRDALSAAERGAEALPGDWRLRRNSAYLLQEWSEAELASNGPEAAIDAVRAVRSRFPDNAEVSRAARSFVGRRINELQHSAQPDRLIGELARYVSLLADEREAERLLAQAVDAAASSHIKAGRWERAAQVYESARRAAPGIVQGAGAYQQNVAFIGQEWLARAGERREAVAAELLATFPEVAAMPKVVASVYMKAVDARLKAGELGPVEAIGLRGADLLGQTQEARRLLRYTYDRLARTHVASEHWQRAVEVYDRALNRQPGDNHLLNNARAAWHSWANEFMSRQDWASAIDIYQRALERLPGTAAFEQNIRYCRQQLRRG